MYEVVDVVTRSINHFNEEFKKKKETLMAIKKLAGALIVSMLSLSSANAALINYQVAYGATDAAALEASYQASAHPGWLFEDFNGFSGLTLGANDQASWIATAPSFSTSVGTFTVTEAAQNDTAEVNPDNLMIESIQTGEFGRDTNKAADDFWLDSNDVEKMTWDLSPVDAKFDSLGFYMVDANDNGASLILRFDDGSTQSVALSTGLSNGEVAYVRFISDVSINLATIVFDNNGDTSSNTNDGFSIDNITVATVPQPTTIALLGLGILAFAARKRF